MALFLVYPQFAELVLAPTILSGNELSIITGNSVKALATIANIKLEVLSVKFETIMVSEGINILIEKLGECESGNNPTALNPVDKDGTPSNGRFQFKRTTWKNYIVKYNLFNWQTWEAEDFENALWDGNAQRMVVEKMFQDPEVNLHWEFPACSQIIGLQKNYATSEPVNN